MTSLIAKTEEMIASVKESSDMMLIVASSSTEGMTFFQMLGNFSILFLSKLGIDANLVIPSCVRRSTKASELSFTLLEGFYHPLKA